MGIFLKPFTSHIILSIFVIRLSGIDFSCSGLSVTLSIYLYIIMCVLVHYYPSTSERAFYKYLTIYQPLFRAFADHTI